jgi:hypothetical protein
MSRPKVSIDFYGWDDREDLETVENIHIAWNAFYNRSIGELNEGIEKAKKELQEDESLVTLEDYVWNMKREDKMVAITNIVALGIGSLHSAYCRLTDNDEEEERRHHQHQLSVAHNQLAIVIKLAELLGGMLLHLVFYQLTCKLLTVLQKKESLCHALSRIQPTPR